MSNYSEGKIYAIKSYQCDDVYIGSTYQSLCRRFSDHKRHYDRYINDDSSSCYVTSYEILQFDDAFIELIEEYPCENRNQLHKKEGEWITKTLNCVNKYMPSITMEEYKEKSRLQKIEYNKTEKGKEARRTAKHNRYYRIKNKYHHK